MNLLHRAFRGLNLLVSDGKPFQQYKNILNGKNESVIPRESKYLITVAELTGSCHPEHSIQLTKMEFYGNDRAALALAKRLLMIEGKIKAYVVVQHNNNVICDTRHPEILWRHLGQCTWGIFQPQICRIDLTKDDTQFIINNFPRVSIGARLFNKNDIAIGNFINQFIKFNSNDDMKSNFHDILINKVKDTLASPEKIKRLIEESPHYYLDSCPTHAKIQVSICSHDSFKSNEDLVRVLKLHNAVTWDSRLL